MDEEKNILRKKIRYRVSYSGMKETDILYEKLILSKLEYLNLNELKLLSNLFNEISDAEIFHMIIDKAPKSKKFKNLFKKILDE